MNKTDLLELADKLNSVAAPQLRSYAAVEAVSNGAAIVFIGVVLIVIWGAWWKYFWKEREDCDSDNMFFVGAVAATITVIGLLLIVAIGTSIAHYFTTPELEGIRAIINQ